MWWQSTGAMVLGVGIIIWAARAFARGWRRSREERARRELLARLATDLRAVEAVKRAGQH